ncbi:MAG: Eco57I restriction-modification methylase domain-containing protein [candidate division WOR-3 bacterium]
MSLTGLSGNLLSEFILELIYNEIKDKYKDGFEAFKGVIKTALNRVKNEADVVDHILRPVFIDILGYDDWHREGGRSGGFRPDIEVYKDGKPVLLIEAKRIGVDFDKASGGRSPARQVKNYLVDYEIRKTIRFGVLTDGLRYRIYYEGKLEDYVEFDFSALAKNDIFNNEKNIKSFSLYYHLLNAKNFPDNLEKAIYMSEGYRFRVSEDLTKKVFYEVIPLIAGEFYKQGEKNLQVLKEKTLILLYRLLFLFYAEDRGLLDLGSYSTRKLRKEVNGKNFSDKSYTLWEDLKAAFKMMDEGDENLNFPKYNGGLFRSDEFFDKYRLSDRVIAEVLGALSYYEGNYINYRTLSVRNLGSIYETVLEYDLKVNRDGLFLEKGEGKSTTRKMEGVYYTPDFVVKFIVENTLGLKINEIIQDTKRDFERIEGMGKEELLKEFKRLNLDPKVEENGRIRDKSAREMREELKRMNDPVERILSLKVLDPAVGSGHFLVEVVNFLVDRILMVINRFEEEMEYKSRFADYDENTIKRIVLKRCVYGVDINPLATELAKVSLWLHTFSTGLPLTFLDHHIKVGNSVYGHGLQPLDWFGKSPAFQKLQHLIKTIDELNDATIEEVERSEEIYKQFERGIVEFREKLNEEIPKLDLNLKPFHFIIEFPDAKDGFDVVLGNPPYIRQERLKGFKESLEKFFKNTFNSRADIYVYFYERGLSLLKNGGYLGLITSNKFMRASYGKDLRRYISNNFKIVKVIDFAGYRVFKDATVDTAIFIIKKEKPNNDHNVEVCKVVDRDLVFTEGLEYEEIKEYQERGKETVSIFEYFNKNKFLVPQNVAFTENIFIIEDLRVLRLKEKIEKVGKPLKDWRVKIYFGIKTGFNEAFIIDTETRNKILANCKTEEERKRTEEIIKPVLRGRDIEKWRYKWAGLWVILAKFGFYKEAHLYPSVVEHLSKYEKQLKARGQCRYTRGGKNNENKDYPGQHHWLELDNNPTDDFLKEFEKEKIVWQRVTQQFAFCLTPKGMYVLDSMAFMVGNNLRFLIGVLNSRPIDYYVKTYVHQYADKGFLLSNQYVERIPIPKISESQQKPIVDLVDKILSLTQSPDYETNKQKREEVKAIEKQIDEIVYKLYGLTEEEVKLIEGGLS